MKVRWCRGLEGKWFLAEPYKKDQAKRRWGGNIEAVRLAFGQAAADGIRRECDVSEERYEWPGRGGY